MIIIFFDILFYFGKGFIYWCLIMVGIILEVVDNGKDNGIKI